MQLDMAGLEDGADFDSEGLAASVALIEADSGAFALQWAVLVHHTAMRTDAAIAPDMRLNEGVGRFLVVIVGSDSTDIGYLLIQ